MTSLPNSVIWPDDFSGKVRLFPLPNLVLFPQVVQPLHVFEPRYCEMLADALQSDQLIAMALLESGWEHSYLTCPPIARTVCIGKIWTHTPTDDGRHNILLVGMKRAKIVRELATERSFREAQVEVLEDYYAADNDGLRGELTEKLQRLFAQFVPEGLAAQESFQQLVGKQLPLGILTDTISYALNLPLSVKQQLLGENNVDIRCRLLTRCLEQQLKNSETEQCDMLSDDFPPKFSTN